MSQKAKALWASKAAKDRGEEFCDPARKDNLLGRKRTRLELWEVHLKDPIIASYKALKCVENPYQSLFLAQSSCEKARVLQWPTVPEMWKKPLCEGVWLYLDPWDSVRLRTASTHWNVPGKCGPHGELFFFLIKKEQVVASHEALPNPCVSAETLKACALIGLNLFWQQKVKMDQEVDSLLRWETCGDTVVQEALTGTTALKRRHFFF